MLLWHSKRVVALTYRVVYVRMIQAAYNVDPYHVDAEKRIIPCQIDTWWKHIHVSQVIHLSQVTCLGSPPVRLATSVGLKKCPFSGCARRRHRWNCSPQPTNREDES
ncbi:hypothetical protein AAC387_Pa02g2780 [Persea americana]